MTNKESTERHKVPGFIEELVYKIYANFDLAELQTLGFNLGVDWEELRGETVASKAFSLTNHLAGRDQLRDLVGLLREEKPNVDWPEISSMRQAVVKDVSQQPEGISIPDATLQEILHLHYPEVWTEIVQRGLYRKTLNLNDLLKKIRDYFNQSELRDICFTLEIDYRQLSGEHYYDKARELISYCKRNGKLNDLIKLCREQRPHIIWDYE